MAELARKLAALRLQAGASGLAQRPMPAVPRSDPKLLQLRQLLKLRPAPAPAASQDVDRRLVGEQLAPGLYRVEQQTPFELAPRLALPELGFDALETSRILAFDTETTGLAGGTGTRAFMVGVADWQRGQLRLRQLYLSSLGGEAAMLREFCSWLRDDTVLLSYNGKGYDRPLLSTRLRLGRHADPLPGLTHIDLLHPLRRRYRGVWPNCRLATAERELIGVCREDDLPGAQAPEAWLSYLRGGSAQRLRRVAEHNAQDLRSLFGLLAWFAQQACRQTTGYNTSP